MSWFVEKFKFFSIDEITEFIFNLNNEFDDIKTVETVIGEGGDRTLKTCVINTVMKPVPGWSCACTRVALFAGRDASPKEEEASSH